MSASWILSHAQHSVERRRRRSAPRSIPWRLRRPCKRPRRSARGRSRPGAMCSKSRARACHVALAIIRGYGLALVGRSHAAPPRRISRASGLASAIRAAMSSGPSRLIGEEQPSKPGPAGSSCRPFVRLRSSAYKVEHVAGIGQPRAICRRQVGAGIKGRSSTRSSRRKGRRGERTRSRHWRTSRCDPHLRAAPRRTRIGTLAGPVL